MPVYRDPVRDVKPDVHSKLIHVTLIHVHCCFPMPMSRVVPARMWHTPYCSGWASLSLLASAIAMLGGGAGGGGGTSTLIVEL
jgi:hypothetical protein